MKANYLLLTLTLSSIVLAPAVQADQLRRGAHRHNFSTDVSRTVGNGKSYNRHTEQTVNDNGFTRDNAITGPNGKTADRHVNVNNDPSTMTHTKTVSGSRLNGNEYSGQRSTTRTDNGYEHHGSYTNANGKTATRDKSVSVDKENNTVTKEVSGEGFNGKSYESTKVKTWGSASDTGAAE